MTEIYLDSAATSLHKPPQVAQAVAEAICKVGNAARGAHGASLSALREGGYPVEEPARYEEEEAPICPQP